VSTVRFTTRRRVEFADTDLSGIVHFTRFFVFMETAEHEFRAARGTELHTEIDGRVIGWPRVSATCSYKKPAKYGDELDIEIDIERQGEKSLTFGFRFLRSGELLAEGKLTSVCCVLNDPAGLKAIEIPPAVVERLTGSDEWTAQAKR